MLDTLIEAQARGGPTPHVAHFNHGLRSDAAEVANVVERQAHAAGLPYTLGTSRNFPLSRSNGASSEAAARTARWAFLRLVARRVEAARILTGHTRDDQAETVIMNLARGSGSRGLAGMRTDDGEILRPLLDISRAEVIAYAEGQGLAFDDDPLNATPDFRRNRIRHDLMPLLNDIYPGASRTIARSAGVIQDNVDRDPIQVREASGVRMPLHPDRMAVPKGPFPEAVVEAARTLNGLRRQLSASQLSGLARALRIETRGRWIELTAGLQAFVCDGAIALYPERVRDRAWRPAVPLPMPGEARVPGGRIVAELRGADQHPPRRRDSNASVLDADHLRGRALTVRAPVPHERVRPEHGPDSRDLIRLLRGRGVATAIADGVPVLEINGRAACVPGVWRDLEFIPGPGTSSIVLVRALWDAMPGPRQRA